MKRTGQVLPSRRMKMQNLKAAHEQRQPALRSKQGSKKDLLLRHPNFVAKSTDASFETPPLACEASALTTELTAQSYIYFSPKNQLCKDRPLCDCEEKKKIAERVALRGIIQTSAGGESLWEQTRKRLLSLILTVHYSNAISGWE